MTGGWLWTAAEAAAATSGTAQGGWEGVTGVSIDTRSIAPGELFVALEGENRDGHDFVAGALEAGAGAAMVARVPEGVAPDAPLLLVDDTLAALGRLGAAARARSAARVIAVTGSVGKTSTKEMLRAMLGCQGRVHAAEKSFNNHWGVPLTLARMPADTEFAVIEMGMNHPGEIAPLSRLARPHVALITTVEPVHLAAFDSVEQIADAKAEVFAGLEPGGTAILNRDNAHFDRLAAQAGGARILGFGTGDTDLVLGRASICATATVVQAQIGELPITFKLGAPGAHFALNAVAALGAVRAVGGDIARAGLAMAAWTPPEGRGRRWRIELGPAGLDGNFTLIDDSYNANPASMRAALAVLAASPVTHDTGRVAQGRRLAFLGDMLELGPTEKTLHAGLAALPELDGIDAVYLAGPCMRAMYDALPPAKRGDWFEDSAKLAERARRVVDAGDVCMVKGSLGMAMRRVVDSVKSLGTALDPQAREEG
ncbi:MAG TPA: UDP-N-acetylmuramoylalanyl-D-glutamyl-2,6-diaminopimelate--D-alanyl-D-alanine ligase [Thermohalobaculum sp.]|nr:UDP-N-acetylmuramoylalanyl-D-glutamyl-2,6-diaminopimelate--D-alanyl-D-alanine ligase [Thermohalobaculum sp.]